MYSILSYFVLLADSIIFASAFLFIIFTLSTFFLYLLLDDYVLENINIDFWKKFSVVMVILTFTLATFVPSSKSLIKILQVHQIEKPDANFQKFLDTLNKNEKQISR